jgi:hypothetical protein
MDKIAELREELKLVFAGRGAGILDALIPFLAFVISNQLASLATALAISAITALFLLIYRLIKKQSAGFALGGLGTALLAAVLAYLSGTESGYYLPGFVTGGLTVIACFASVAIKRPIAAYSSHLTRRWPLDWYWHEQVMPAYKEVSLFWGIAFDLRLTLELILFNRNQLDALGTVRVIMGWPYTILVLVASYLYGQKRLQSLGGPSVEEFKAGTPPPWQGQMRGF